MPEQKEQPGSPLPQPEWKHDFSPGPNEEELRRFEGPKMSSSDEDAEKQRLQEQEFRARSEYLGREEQFSRRDPELQLLLFPENSRDISKAVLRVLEKYTNLDLREASSPYKIQYYMDAADACEFIFGHSIQDLIDEGYVQGQIDSRGYLSEGGRPKKFGYAIRVDTEKREITIKEQKERRYEGRTEKTTQTHYLPKFNSEGKIESLEPVQVEVEVVHPPWIEKWEEVSTPTIAVEKFYYGTDNERRALYNAAKASYERLVNTARQHDLFLVLESNRADLSGLVTILYLKGNHISNEQWKEIFNSPDIGKITQEKPLNNEYGWRIDKAMRMMDLLGHAETREKMEDFMNRPTFEKIVAAVKDRAIEVMKYYPPGYKDEEAKTDEERVARFLVGKGAVKRGERWVLEGWKTTNDRDPSKATPEEIKWWKDKDERWTRGFAAVKWEKNKDLRGFLTDLGNVWARGEAGEIELMLGRIRLLLGDRNAVRDADRIFQLTGMRDELNLEVLSKKLPTAEEIIATHRVKGDYDYDQWRDQAKWWLEYFKLAGDPTASDLSKIFYPQFYRLKDILRDRPAGPLLTTFDFDRLTQSMFSLGRSKVKIMINGVEEDQTRSILEQWRGYSEKEVVVGKERIKMSKEEARDLGEIDWDAIHVPEDIKEAVEGLRAEMKEDLEKTTEAGAKGKIEEELKKLMDEAKGAVKGGLWSYYALMNWLAGRDNVIKAPWLFALDEKENPRVINILETYTSKEKFLSIIWHGSAVTWGEWRSLYAEHKATKEVDKIQDEKAEKKVAKGKRDWYRGVRNLPQFPEIMAQRVKVIRAGTTGYGEFDVPMIERVEGRPAEPGLVVQLGFMSMEELKENTTKRLVREQQQRL